jgi:hypothetical protein
MELGKRGKGKKDDRTSVILWDIRREGRGCKDMYWKPVEKWVVGGKEVKQSIQKD